MSVLRLLIILIAIAFVGCEATITNDTKIVQDITIDRGEIDSTEIWFDLDSLKRNLINSTDTSLSVEYQIYNEDYKIQFYKHPELNYLIPKDWLPIYNENIVVGAAKDTSNVLEANFVFSAFNKDSLNVDLESYLKFFQDEFNNSELETLAIFKNRVLHIQGNKFSHHYYLFVVNKQEPINKNMFLIYTTIFEDDKNIYDASSRFLLNDNNQRSYLTYTEILNGILEKNNNGK